MPYAQILEQIQPQKSTDVKLLTLSFTVIAAEISENTERPYVKLYEQLLALTSQMESTQEKLLWPTLVQRFPELSDIRIESFIKLKELLHSALLNLALGEKPPVKYDWDSYKKTGIFEATASALTWREIFSSENPSILRDRGFAKNPFRDPRIHMEIKSQSVPT